MGTLTIVGLGPGAAGNLSVETMALLKSDAQVILRTAVHPTVEELQKQQVEFISCDDFYEQGASFEEVYGKITDFVLQKAAEEDVVYAVPGSPLVAERTVVLLREAAKSKGIKTVIKPSMSFLDLAYVELEIDPIAGLRIIDAQDFSGIADAGKYPLMITQVYSQLVASDLKITLMENLADDAEIYFLRNLGLPDEECRKIKIFELDRQPHIDHLTSVFVPESSSAAEQEESCAEENDAETEVMYEEAYYDDVDIQPLVDVMKTLREPGGCPWDIEQTHSSIRSNMIEEVYEFLEAVDNNDIAGMREELGDVLMQVVFHARIEEEAGNFDLQDVIDEVTDKLIRRHPHVFGDVDVENSAEVLKNWDMIKKQEKTERTKALDGVAQGLPALMRAYELQSKAAKVGFDWDNKDDVWNKVKEEIAELEEALNKQDKLAAAAEFGDVLFALINYARHCQIEPETALNGTNNRFTERFNYVEEQVKKSGKQWNEFSLEQLDEFWNAVKKL